MHVPVLLREVIEYLDVQPNRNYIDATLGGGGYTREILKRNGPAGKVIAIDLNEEAIKKFKDVSERTTLVHGNFRDISTLVRSKNISAVAGVVFDLGLSSDLLESSGRGFSFERDEPLIMSYQSPTGGHPMLRRRADDARTIINSWSERELERIFREYGEERGARRIARAITEARRKKRIETTRDLVQVIELVTRSVKTKARIFQALRIAVNDELENLKKGLEGAWEILAPKGRIVVVSYHSLEDRIVKNFFRERAKAEAAEILTKKPVRPTKEEILKNPKARSAKLRAVEKL